MRVALLGRRPAKEYTVPSVDHQSPGVRASSQVLGMHNTTCLFAPCNSCRAFTRCHAHPLQLNTVRSRSPSRKAV
eukprot:COSAG01_NODE_41398_length_452_cov_0.419263_1_plen_74_part_10